MRQMYKIMQYITDNNRSQHLITGRLSRIILLNLLGGVKEFCKHGSRVTKMMTIYVI